MKNLEELIGKTIIFKSSLKKRDDYRQLKENKLEQWFVIISFTIISRLWNFLS